MTLADLLVSTAVLGLTLSATLTALDQGQRAWAMGAARVEAQQSGRAALAWLAAELRTAGQGPGPRAIATLTITEPTRLALRLDRNRDGLIAGAAEQITWRLAGDILRRDAGGGGQPVVNAVRALTLAYFDAAGLPTTQPAAVRRVSITLVTGAERALAPPARGLAAVFSTDVHLRNQ